MDRQLGSAFNSNRNVEHSIECSNEILPLLRKRLDDGRHIHGRPERSGRARKDRYPGLCMVMAAGPLCTCSIPVLHGGLVPGATVALKSNSVAG